MLSQRKYGRSLKNTRVSKRGNFTRGTRYSVLGAVSTQGFQAAHSVVGAFDKHNFEFFFFFLIFFIYILPLHKKKKLLYSKGKKNTKKQ